ncbi:MAG: PEP-CTERM sorting domain-containing protein [Phenylobacterium sp.]|nr:MAG: PEP-CTERM sorting domain-containing protein [Phenylobacterium sp.]
MITDENSDPAHQSFAIGWPNAVPEPATWALMLTGFFGVGGMLRRRQAAAAA